MGSWAPAAVHSGLRPVLGLLGMQGVLTVRPLRLVAVVVNWLTNWWWQLATRLLQGALFTGLGWDGKESAFLMAEAKADGGMP